MIERKLSKLGGKVTRASLFVTRDLSSSIKLERSLEKKSLDLKRKIVEDRGRILKNIGSRDKDSQTGGLLGGALGLLGIGGGGGLLRRGLRRTPRSPSQLLRMQRGTSSLSRVGRLGRLARPLAAVGTGLDFIGRRAEGQSNVQAGVGAAGGLAGSIAGAKTGALLGTAIAGPLGTAVGGVGGAIIGSLAGGRIADLFTGANRRRRFEEERTVARTQKTLFSDALDDFDKVLDKFEDVAPALVLRRGGDDEEEGAAGSKRPPLPTPFFKRPAVKKTGQVLTVAALLSILALSAKRGKVDPKTYNKILEKVIAKRPFLKKLSEKEQVAAIGKIIERSLPKSAQQRIRMNASPFLNKRGTVVPGQKGAPGISKKGKEIRNLTKAERDELASERLNLKDQRRVRRNKRLEEKIKKQEQEDAQRLKEIENDPDSIKIQESITRQSGVDVNLDQNRLTKRALEFIEKMKPQIVDRTTKSNAKASMDSINRRLTDQRTQILDKIDVLKEIQRLNPKESTAIRLKDAQRALKIIEDFARKFVPKKIRQKGGFDISSINPNPDSNNLALAPSNNIFVINQAPANQINVVEDTNDFTMIDRTDNSFASLNKYAEFTSVAFTT